ncbi:MAG TPA: FAD-dependent monooxygenase [Ktedonobacterales bacterium]|nr:FAD-dependent monooxygenase [Ktedonobacterales bacterium]
MREMATRRVLIVGAGIGGLVTAIALRREGVDVSLFERASDLAPMGAGLTIWANAITTLQRIGLGDMLASIGKPLMRSRILSWRGDTLAETPVETLARRFGTPMVAVHRADLQDALLAALGPGVVRTDAAGTGFTQDGAQARLRLASGEEVAGDLLIGADGLRSTIRAQLFGATPPRYAGYTAWRGIARITPPQWAEAMATETWGGGRRFGLVPLSNGRMYWFATLNAPQGARDRPGGRKRELLDLFASCHDPAPAVIEATDEAAILRNDIYDRPPLASWSRGRVTLIGDAAHPTTPNMGQGACQAIEDAAALAERLRADATIANALKGYEARRLARANAIVQQSRRLGEIAQWENRWAAGLRDTLFSMLPDSMLFRPLEAVLEPA